MRRPLEPGGGGAKGREGGASKILQDILRSCLFGYFLVVNLKLKWVYKTIVVEVLDFVFSIFFWRGCKIC